MKTPVILLFIHTTAFLMLLAGQIAPGPVTNGIVMIGLVFEFPGWFVGALFLRTAIPLLAFTFFANALLYFGGGLVIDWGTRRRNQQPSN